jgi:hypothetical protein
MFTALEHKNEIEEYLEKSDTEEQTTETTWMHLKKWICQAA